METRAAYFPHGIFVPADRGELPRPRVFISPQRYIQGRAVLDGMGGYLSLTGSKRVALLTSARGSRNEGARVRQSLHDAGIEVVESIFAGECSLAEITRHADALDGAGVDCVIAAGGGKCVDAGKAVAFRIGTPVVVVPTLASNDAPCSALSVLYSVEGVSSGVEFYPHSPAIVVVDTDVVAEAPERYLVAGIGDAMATWYEARVCMLNENAITTIGARPTLAATAIGETCARTLFEHGAAACSAVLAGAANEALEAVVEANTLLSGLGFESGGLAAAHGVAQSCTAIPAANANHLHGEMVAIGTLAQLMMEARPDEATRVAEFFATVGLPVHLGQLSVDAGDTGTIDTIVEGVASYPFIGNMPRALAPEDVRSAVLDADRLGSLVADRVGDAAFRRIQKG